MQTPPPAVQNQHRPKSNRTVPTIVLAAVLGPILLCGVCGVCSGFLSLFVTTDRERADALWDEGKKAEAVTIYRSLIDESLTRRPDPTERTVTYLVDQEDTDQAKHYLEHAIEKEIELTFDRDDLQKLLAEVISERKALQEKEGNETIDTELPVEGNTPKDDTREFRQLVGRVIGNDGLRFKIYDYANDPEQKVIQVFFLVGDNLTNGMIRDGAKIDIQEILKAADTSGIKCFEVTVHGSFPLVDKFGNSTKEIVIKATFKGETIDRVNWKNFLSSNVYEIADDVWVHPAFRS